MSTLTIAELLKLATAGKATTSQQLQLAKMLAEQAQEQEKNELGGKIEKLKEFAKSLELTEEQIIGSFQKPKELIFEVELNGVTYQRFAGTLGKANFTTELKAKYTKEEAKKFAKNDKGLAFVETAYKTKTAKTTA